MRSDHEPTTGERPRRSRVTIPGILLGVGLGGLVDGIVIHQMLQWHHMGTDYGEHATFPTTTVRSLEHNTLWDGMFHSATWIFVTVGLFMLWRALAGGHRCSWRSLAGLLLAGWGIFNIVEGVIDHMILGIHHVRDDLGGPVSWDIGFLLFGALLVAGGWAMWRADQRRPARAGEPTASTRSRSPL